MWPITNYQRRITNYQVKTPGFLMDSASSLAFPSCRAVAPLCKALDAHRPAALWAGYLWVHRIEALAEIAEPRPLDPLAFHVLGGLAIGLRPPPPALDLAAGGGRAVV